MQKQLLLWFLSLTTFFPTVSIASKLSIVNLRTEYTSTPLGLDVSNPEFSWQMQSERRGARQRAFRIVVVNEQGIVVWIQTR
ncbi:glycoside hydrolase family 78 protein [Sphingobacterium griseoflavum]|uniref:glycoside hydrolase family 78 protein n=1 Tax=Sphingobacterium griseoflavum TaxID=1474952 RepID=UPI0016730334|nr:hypothetical protein [Sphingobacterium griseoflavum]